MNDQPQMFFVRSCAEILPQWLKTPIPGLHVFDKKIPYLSVLDAPIRVSGLLSEVEVDEVSDNSSTYEQSFYSQKTFAELEMLGELALEESEEFEEEDFSPSDPEAIGSFYLEGILRQGTSSEFSVNGSDFLIDQSTVISGNLHYGAVAAVQGNVIEDGTKIATIVVSD